MSTELFAPFPLMSGATANIINPATGRVYTLSARGSVFVADTDVPYFLTQGYIKSGGGGGGGGTVVSGVGAVTTIAGLIALPVPLSGSIVVVSDPNRGGPFVWSATNHSADVTNDPGQGITLAPSSDTSGASGAWIRQYEGRVRLKWWGFIGDGTPTIDPFGNLGIGPIVGTGTDNGVPFVNFGKWARAQYAAGRSIQAKLDPGYYLWNGATSIGDPTDYRNAAGWSWAGVNNIDLDLYGATIQQIYNESISGANGAANCPLPFPLHDQMFGYLIGNTVVGTNTFTLLNIADVSTSNIRPGITIALGSIDLQYESPPPNVQQFEFLTIKSISGATVTTVEAIAYAHRTDFVDFLLFSGQEATGAGRMWVFDQSGVNAWEGKFILRGGHVNLAPGIVSPGKYVTIAKRSYETYDWYGVGFSESEIRDAVHYNPSFFTQGEVDKAIGQLTYHNIQAGSLNIQSPFPGLLNVYGGNFGGIGGGGKRTLVQGAKLAFLGTVQSYGLNTSTRYVECEIANVPSGSFGIVTDGATLLDMSGGAAVFDGVTLGLIKVDLTGLGFTATTWGMVPGQWINLQASNGMFSNDLGSGLIMNALWLIETLGTPTGGSGYVNGTYANVPLTGGSATGSQAFANITVTGGAVTAVTPMTGLSQLFALNAPTGGSGYVNGTYPNVPLTNVNGAGTGAAARIVVSGGAVTSLTIVNPGKGYAVGFTLSASTASLGGSGSGFAVTIAAISNGGVNYQPGDVLTTPNVNLGGTGSGFSVPVATMKMNLITTLPYSSLPSWASGKLYRFGINELEFVNCQGADLVRQASDAYRNGMRYYEYKKMTFAGGSIGLNSFAVPPGCMLTEIQINVRQPSSISTAVLDFTMSSTVTPTFVADPFPGIDVTVQVGVAGTRIWNTTAATGINPGGATLDKLQVGGVTQTLLPTNRLVGPSGYAQLFTQSSSAGGNPIVDVICKFSAGMVRHPLPRQYDDSGTLSAGHIAIPVQGILP